MSGTSIQQRAASVDSLPKQSCTQVLMVRPHHFQINAQTREDNAFQLPEAEDDEFRVSQLAYREITHAVHLLRSHGIEVKLFEDRSNRTPDSVFPNNWFSTHLDGTLCLYPMLAENRRLERRKEIIRYLERRVGWKRTLDFRDFENQGDILEGTGALVFDHGRSRFFVARSSRTSDLLIQRLSQELNMDAMAFDAHDEHGRVIYHSNVMMALGTSFAVVCMDAVQSGQARGDLIHELSASGRELVPISLNQMRQFCGNMLELEGRDGSVLVMSTTAYAALTSSQKRSLRAHAYLQPIHMPTIEGAGGSIRCTIAELF